MIHPYAKSFSHAANPANEFTRLLRMTIGPAPSTAESDYCDARPELFFDPGRLAEQMYGVARRIVSAGRNTLADSEEILQGPGGDGG